MTATAHALVAGAIAAKFSDPVTASGLAVASHFIMDSIPHWDFGTNWRSRSKEITGLLAIAETVAGITIAYLIYAAKAPAGVLIPAIIFSVIPDWLETPWYIFFASQNKHEPAKNGGFWEHLTYRIYKAENYFHSKAQYPLGLLTQIGCVLFFLVLLK